MIRFPKYLLFLAITLIVFSSCKKEKTKTANCGGRYYFSESQSLGKGSLRAWVMEREDGTPGAVGVSISKRALENTPHSPIEFVLPIPKKYGENFYTHAYVSWNPHGHDPNGIYDINHFDVHFYTIPSIQREIIHEHDSLKFNSLPAAQYVPKDYIKIPGGVPKMGAHWVDSTAQELKGTTFTKTFLWGSFNGRFIFYEPMITYDYLTSRQLELIPIKQPTAYQLDGWYPMMYKIAYSGPSKEYSVSLENLTFHLGQ
jgi:hypothetical protein